MYVRNCYVTLANYLLNESEPAFVALQQQQQGQLEQQQHEEALVPQQAVLDRPNWSTTLVLGTKGIGKTMFLNYLIVRIVDKHNKTGAEPLRSIVYCERTGTADNVQRIHFVNGNVTIDNHRGGEYFLSDSVDVTDRRIGELLTLEVASEDDNNYKHFRQRVTEANGQRYYMYPWTVDELTAIKPAAISVEEVQFLFDVFGGVVRYFLGGSRIEANDNVNDLVEQCALWYFSDHIKITHPATWHRALHQIRQVLEDAKGKTTKTELAFATSMFWHCHKSISNDAPHHPQQQLPQQDSGFASKFLEYLAGHINSVVEASIWNAMSEIFGNSVKGVIFEAIGHNKLTTTNKEYTSYILKKGGRKKFKFNFFGLPRILIRSIADIVRLPLNKYGLPIFSNYPLVDSVVQPDKLINFAVGESHGRESDVHKWQVLRQGLLEKNRKKHKLIFVIPASRQGMIKVVGVPHDLEIYWMNYEDTVDESVVRGRKRKERDD